MIKRHAVPESLTDLGSGIGEIRQACEELGAEAHRSPFFFIVGAGISYPPVPLAANIIEHCKQVAGRYKRDAAAEGAAVLDLYSTWFGRAYPGARQRQKYLRSLIEQKPLSIASLRLAHLLSARRLTNVVITTNFDDFIPRALRLFGQEPSVCDHPRTIGRIDSDQGDAQIVHVHGSYLFYDLANLRGEVTARARPEKDSSFTMMGLLDSLLWARSPLVIGYAGWEGDIIMSALRRRLRGGNPLAQSIYWFCYRRSDLDALPAWLRSSADVRFVVPPAAAQAASAAGEERAGPSGDPPPEPTMPAYEVFDRLNESFQVGEPAIFQNPVRYFARTLQASLPDVDGSGDPYSFKALIDRLNKAAASYEATTRPTHGIETDLHKLRGLMRESNYVQATKLLAKIIPQQLGRLDDTARKEVLGAARLAGTTLLSKQKRTQLARAQVGEDLTRVAVFDPVIDRLLGDVPPGTAWCVGSRSDQFGFETAIDGEPHGAFTAALIANLMPPRVDLDNDGRISILESVIATAQQLVARTENWQIPVVAGDADRIALFASKRGIKPAYGTLHAVLVGVSKYGQMQISLRGPGNDVDRVSTALRSTTRRLFKKAELHVLRDKEATQARVTRMLKAVAKKAAAGDLVLLYFSGHGTKTLAETKKAGPEGISLILYDYNESGTAGSLTNREVAAILAGTKAAHSLLILDF